MPRRKTQEEYEKQVEEKASHVIVTGKYDGNRTPIEHYCLKHNISWDVSPFNFLQHPTGCKCCQEEAMSRHIASIQKTDEQFKKEVNALGTGIIPMSEYKGCHVKMPFQCAEAHVWISTPHDVLEGYGCPYCAGQKVLVGFNDLWTTDPDIAKMLCNPSDGYTISRGSNQKVEWLCPFCKTKKLSSPKHVASFGLSCSVCSDKISYPNKFIVSLLLQLNVDVVVPEWSPEWIGRYSYDVYFVKNNKEYIVEMDGGLGHGNIDFKTGERDVEGLNRDIIKSNAAKEHHIELIRIDCNYIQMRERFDYVKKSILNSELKTILELSLVDWDECNKYATKSLHMEAANLYDSGLKIREISDQLKVSYSTVYNWLKRLSKEGLCSYNPVLGRSKK
jgi:hypothetical protein